MKLGLLVVTSIAYTITTEAGQWVKGADGLACDQVCGALNPPAACNADIQSTITSSAAVKAAFAKAGYECTVSDFANNYRDYAGAPFVVSGNGYCYHLTPNGAKSVCNANANSQHSALCYCEHSAGQWVKGAIGQVCNDVCGALNPPTTCNADMQSTIISSAALRAAFAEAGYNCLTIDERSHRDYAGTPFSTQRVDNDDCYFLTPGGAKSVCDANSHSNHYPLCYCDSTQDLCNDAETRCNDNDECTIDSCDESTGDCINEDKICDDQDDCTTNSCDTNTGECKYEDIVCSNGEYCDGEEYCDGGQCMDAVDISCPTNFVCDEEAKDCVRNCHLFAIDGYLKDCSSEFAGNEYDIAELQGNGQNLQNQINGINGRVSDLESGIDLLEDALIIVQDQIGESLQENPDTIYNMLASQFEDINNVETALSEAKEQLGGEITDINNDIDGIKSDITAIEEDIEDIKTGAQGIVTRVETLETTLASLDELVKAFGQDSAGQWVKGAIGEVCNDVCGALNPPTTCNADIQSTIISSAALKAAFAEAGYNCLTISETNHRDYAGTPFSTQRGDNDDCYFLTPGGAKSVCDANSHGNHYPLCYCGKKEVGNGQSGESVVGVPFISWDDKNILIVGLLIFNMMLLIVLLAIVYWCMSKKKYTYQPIDFNSETDQEVTALNK